MEQRGHATPRRKACQVRRLSLSIPFPGSGPGHDVPDQGHGVPDLEGGGRVKGLGVAGSDRVGIPPGIDVEPVEDRGRTLGDRGLVGVEELAPMDLKGPDPLLVMPGHVDDEGRSQPGRQEVVVDGLRLPGFPFDRHLPEVGEVEGLGDEHAGLEVVVVSEAAPDGQVIVGREDELRPVLADHLGDLAAVLEGVLDAAVPEVQVLADVELEDGGRPGALLVALLGGAPAHLAPGHVDDARGVAQRLHLEEHSAAPDLGIVGMGAEREDVDRHARSPNMQGLRVTSDSRAVRSPWSGDEVGRVEDATPARLDAAVANAVRGFATWRATPAWKRGEALAAISAGITADREGFARSIALEAAKPIKDARTEVDRAAHTFALAAGEAVRMAGEWLPLDTLPGNEGRSALVRRVPLGPVLGITPFNFPLNLVAHKVAPALAAGASIVIKPAPQTPLVALRLGALAARSGVPEDVFAVVPTSNDHAARLVEDERFAVLSFTGSPGVGWTLKGRAGRKRVLLELGGNAAAIVHADADVEAAVRRAIVGGFAYSGQVCISVQRVYVHRARFDDFVERFVEGVRGLAFGDPLDEATQVSALIRPAEAERLTGWVAEATAAGARTLVGGAVLPGPGGPAASRGLAPTVLTGTAARPDLKVV